jgi:hypothetical protein
MREMRATFRLMVLPVAALLAFAAWSTSSGAQSASACSLATNAEIETVTGRRFYSDPEPTSLAGGAGSACTYGTGKAQIVLFSGPKSQELWNDFLKSYGRDKEARHPVPAVGDGAYVIYPRPRDEYEDAIGMLVVKSGAHTLGISLAATKGEPAESVQPKLVALAEAVVAKLR